MPALPLLLAAIAAVTLASYASQSWADDAWTTVEESAEKAFVDGKYDEADKLWKQALTEAEKLGPDDPKVAQTINQMTHLLIKQGRYDEDVPLLQRALAIRRKNLGENNISTAETLGNLALVTHKQGRDAEAEKLYKEVLEIKEKKLGDSSPSVAITKTNLANLYAEMKKCTEAKELYLSALAIDEKAYGPNNEEVAADLLNVGALLYHCDHPADAVGYLTRAIKINAGNDAAKIPALHYLGLCNAKLKNPSAAEDAYRQALDAQEKVKGKGHPDTIVHLLNIARVADEQGRSGEAEQIYKNALTSLQNSKDPQPYKTTECLIEIAHFYKRHQNLTESEKYYTQALQSYDTLSRADQRQLYELPRAYADLLHDLKRNNDSEAMAKKYLHLYEPSEGEQIK